MFTKRRLLNRRTAIAVIQEVLKSKITDEDVCEHLWRLTYFKTEGLVPIKITKDKFRKIVIWMVDRWSLAQSDDPFSFLVNQFATLFTERKTYKFISHPLIYSIISTIVSVLIAKLTK